MLARSLFILLVSPGFLLNASGQDAGRDILRSSITENRLHEVLLSGSTFSPLPKADDPFWSSLDMQSRQYYIKKGEELLNHEWPSLLARRYMDFDIDGNRTRYSSRYYGRRDALSDLCMAEIVENKGRFLDDIVNGVWLLLEETTWVVPAHSSGNKLHDINDVTVDLFSAETAALLAWTDYYFGEQFDEITPLIRQRIYYEVNRRVIQSMLDHDDFWYMGYTGQIPNNWNPWIVSNWLAAVLLLEKDDGKRQASVWKALEVLDNYLNPFPADGGCDEGPGYWGRAAASLFDCLYLLDNATKGNIDVYKNPLIRNMGSYIYKIKIDDSWFVNFSDGSAINHHEAGTLFRIGAAINDKHMMADAAEQFNAARGENKMPAGRSPFGQRIIPDLMIMDQLEKYDGKFIPEPDYVFPNLEVVVSRENKDQSGFFLAIKGGFNNESHNHNDAGSFVVYYDGLPLVIDAGVGTYTRKTFSDERYDIWTMQSAYHNLPTLNGVMQHEGDEYKAEKFSYDTGEDKTVISMDLAGAYPAEAFTDSWNRSVTLDRNKGNIILCDTWQQQKQTERNMWHFLLAFEPVVESKGNIKLSNGESELNLTFGAHFSPAIEKIELKDPRLSGVWGENIWRLTLTTTKKGLKGSEIFTIQKNN